MEAKLSEQITDAQDGVDEVRVKVVQSENERKKMVEKLDLNSTEVKKFKEELQTLKDVIRRQQEMQHMELKKEILELTPKMDTFIADINLARSVT